MLQTPNILVVSVVYETHIAEDGCHPVNLEVMLLLEVVLQLLNPLMRLLSHHDTFTICQSPDG